MTIAKVLYTAKTRTTGGWDGAFDIVAAWTAFTIRHTTTLARLSAGRILLHLLAMLHDRCVGFHVAGMIRELRWVAPALTLLTRTRARLIGALVLYPARPSKRSSPEPSADPQSFTAVLNRSAQPRPMTQSSTQGSPVHSACRTLRTCAAATALLLTLIPSARAGEVPGYSFEAAAQEITQLFWLAETASACGWARDGEATKFIDFSVRFLTAHLSHTHKQALVSLVSEEHYKAQLRRAAWEGADENCANSRWRLGWLSYKAAADEHETEY